ncbi:unnamed protein product, partial [Soboliphyme baturini]|uniref:Lipoma HMGIC fusion partner-like 2 protein n=1 Tax=Soboliphyme baturini TaxID=241478 RepID=A0A183IQJ6_9BILA
PQNCDSVTPRSRRFVKSTTQANNGSDKYDLSSPWITVLSDIGMERFSDESSLFEAHPEGPQYICASTWKYTTGASCFIVLFVTNLIVFFATFCRGSVSK